MSETEKNTGAAGSGAADSGAAGSGAADSGTAASPSPEPAFAVPYWAPERSAEAGEAAVPAAPYTPPGWAAPAARMSRTARMVTASLCALALVVAVAVGWLMYSTNSMQAAENSRVDAPIAAADQVKLMFEFDHGTVREQMAKALEGTTGDFRGEFEREINENVIPNAENAMSTVSATVIAQGAVSATKDTATVLVYVNQVVNASTGPKATFTPSRLMVDMTKVDGNWKVSGLTAV